MRQKNVFTIKPCATWKTVISLLTPQLIHGSIYRSMNEELDLFIDRVFLKTSGQIASYVCPFLEDLAQFS